jgi:hypothetical protein
MDTAQVVFSFFFDAYALLNMIFLALGPASKKNFLNLRLFTVHFPTAVLFSLQIVSMIIFLRNLDDINQKLDNIYPVDDESSLMK